MKNVFKAPAWVLMLATFFLPMAIIVVYSLLSRGGYGEIERPFTLENYTRLFDPLYGIIFARSVWIAAVATILCMLLGFPLALFIARSGPRKNLWLTLVILPFWT